MSRETAEKWCERGILGLVLAILVYGPLATGAVRTVDFLVIQGLTMGVLVLWGLRLSIEPETADPLDAALLGGPGICGVCHRPLRHGAH